MLLLREPLHIARIISSAFAQRDNMINFAPVTSGRLRVGPLELGDGVGIPLDLAVAVSGTTLAFDRTTGMT